MRSRPVVNSRTFTLYATMLQLGPMALPFRQSTPLGPQALDALGNVVIHLDPVPGVYEPFPKCH